MIAEAREIEEVGVGILTGALVLVPVHSPGGTRAVRMEKFALALAGGIHILEVEMPRIANLFSSRQMSERELAVGVVTADQGVSYQGRREAWSAARRMAAMVSR